MEAVNFYHGIKTAYCSANLIQAQGDYFGAHTYHKVDKAFGNSYHTVVCDEIIYEFGLIDQYLAY